MLRHVRPLADAAPSFVMVFVPRLVAALAAVVVVSTGCSLLVSRGADQCVSNTDCQARGGAFATAVCTPDRTCAATTGASCAKSSDCTPLARDGGASPRICDRTTKLCADLLSEDCPRYFGDATDDNAVVVGALNGIRGINASTGVAFENAMALATSEISQTAVGLPGGAGGVVRPFAFLSCDDSVDAVRAARHITTDLHLPAIMGASDSGKTIRVAQLSAIPTGTFLISSSATSPVITGLADNGLVWRTAPSDTLQAVAIRDQLGAVETIVKATRAPDRVKLAVVSKGDAYGSALSSLTLAGLTLNGYPVGAPENAGAFVQSEYAPTSAPDVSSSLVALAPDIVLLVGTTEAVTSIVVPLEAAWPAGVARPYYVLADGVEVTELLDACKSDNALRERLRGTVPRSEGPLTDSFNLRYGARYGDTAQIFGVPGAYDGVYLVAYAVVALGASSDTVPVDGRSIASAMPQMVGGSRIEVGPGGINDAFRILRSGAPIDFDGASGPLDFDIATGEAPSNIDVFCVARNGAGLPFFQSSGRRYNAVTRGMEGAYDCK